MTMIYSEKIEAAYKRYWDAQLENNRRHLGDFAMQVNTTQTKITRRFNVLRTAIEAEGLDVAKVVGAIATR